MAIPRYNKCTIWSKGSKDAFSGLTTLGEARVYKCELKRGGSTKLADKKGSEFYPSSTFWVRLSDLVTGVHIEPNEGEMIAQGDYASEDAPSNAGAEVIRSVTVHNHMKFGESDSYTIGTQA